MNHITNMLDRTAEIYPDQIALQIKKGKDFSKITFAQLRDKAICAAHALVLKGFERGNTMAILTENSPLWGLSFFSILYAGGTVVPIDAKLKEHSIRNILDHADCKWIFVSGQYKQTLATALKDSDAKSRIIVMDDEGESSLGELIRVGSRERSGILEKSKPDDLALLLYTSGTTGAPKGVMLTHKNISSNVESVCSLFFFKTNDQFLAVLPLCHTFAITADFLIPIYVGATITYLEALKGNILVERMRETRTSVLIAVPAVLELLLRGILQKINSAPPMKKFIFQILKTCSALGFALGIPLSTYLFKKLRNSLSPNLRMFISGGAPIDAKVIKTYFLFGIPVYQGYGLTETSPITNVNHPRRNIIGSVGKSIPGVQIRFNEDHEIIVRGPNIMKGYYKNPEATNEVIKEGWFYTGDIGKLDRNGFLFISGRAKNVIVSRGGKNIYPEELEEELIRNPYIKEACVLGIQKERKDYGKDELVHALLVPDFEFIEADGHGTEAELIKKHMTLAIRATNQRLADYKRIVDFDIWKEFPKTTTLKIKRKEIKEMFLNKQAL